LKRKTNSLHLDEVPADKKIAILKLFVVLTGRLKEAKELVESAPKQVQEVAKDAAEEAKKQIEAAGGKASLV
jgi:large subunit ribosomal protein L7/L12